MKKKNTYFNMKTQKDILSFMNNCKGSHYLGLILFNPINAEFTHDDHKLNIEMVKDMIKNKLIKPNRYIDFLGVNYIEYILC